MVFGSWTVESVLTQVETVQTFGPDVTSASYGETFFRSWKASAGELWTDFFTTGWLYFAYASRLEIFH